MKVPFVDLLAQYNTIKGSIDKAIEQTILNSSYIGGSAVKKFEDDFGAFIGVKNVISCANGTDSLEILLQAYGIGPGDEVIVPAVSWISTSEAVTTVGAKVVFVDIEKDYYTIDPAKIEAVISEATRAIIPVHLYGHPADMNAILQIAEKHKLIVIEDCAQAHGSEIGGKMTGTFGHAASFSFYPGKNLGAYGDAGCMVTDDDMIAEKARMIANHGQKGKHNHLMEGRNSRLDGLQAAILLAKLPHLKQWTDLRIEQARQYSNALSNLPISLPETKEGFKHVFHLYVVRVDDREQLQKNLAADEIETFIHYPKALPFLQCYRNMHYKESDFPVASSYQDTILSLPIFPELSNEARAWVVSRLRDYYGAEK